MKKTLNTVRILALVIAVILAVSAAAFAEEENDHLAEILNRGALIVGTEGTWSPYTYHDEDNALIGFDVEVTKIIADYLGVEIQYTESLWSSIFGALDAGQIDTVVNEVSYTAERAEKYDFSIPYTYTQRAILVLADNDEINGLEDIKGKKASNDPTSSIGQFAEENGAILEPVGEMAQSISEVLFGRSDLTVNTTVAFADYLAQHPENESRVKIIVVTDPAPSGYVPVLKDGKNVRLLEKINEALTKAQEDGTLSALSIKYFGVDITKEE